MNRRHIPIRKCAGCGKKHEKSKFIRIVKKDGKLMIDDSKKINTRGMYICFNAGCLKEVRKKRKIERTFSIGVDEGFGNKLEKVVYGTE